MTGFDTADGWQARPMDDRDSEDPDFTIDPIYSGVDGGGERPDRHRGLQPDGSYETRTAAEEAAVPVEVEP